jgi:ATP-dependent Clp protease, protease subunit
MHLFALAALFISPVDAEPIQVERIDELSGVVISAALDARAGTPEIHLYFNSPGGLVSAGLEIIRAMERAQRAGSTLVCTAELAASMGAVIFSSCDVRLALPRALFLIHGAAVSAKGDAVRLRELAGLLEATTDALLRHIARVTRISFAELRRRCYGRDYWLDAGRASRIGLVQEILP